MKSDYRPVLYIAREYIELPGNEVGGNLHIVLEDGNLKDKNIEFCHMQAMEAQDYLGMYLSVELLRLSMTQRRKVYLNLRKKESEHRTSK